MNMNVKDQNIKNRLKLVEEQFHMWEAEGGKAESAKKAGGIKFITLSRQYGCAGFRIVERLAEILNVLQPARTGEPRWTVYDRMLVDTICRDHNLGRMLVTTIDRLRKNVFSDYITGMFTGEPSSIKVFKQIAETVFRLAAGGRVILIGRASALITQKLVTGLHARIVAPLDWRVKQVADYEKITPLTEARHYVMKKDNERGQFAVDFLGHSVAEPEFYDLVLNQEKLGIEKIVQLILKTIELKECCKEG
jgi:cytidylate kinase